MAEKGRLLVDVGGLDAGCVSIFGRCRWGIGKGIKIGRPALPLWSGQALWVGSLRHVGGGECLPCFVATSFNFL
jgi:hypothetical protein